MAMGVTLTWDSVADLIKNGQLKLHGVTVYLDAPTQRDREGILKIEVYAQQRSLELKMRQIRS
jgi:hypothetical protein